MSNDQPSEPVPVSGGKPLTSLLLLVVILVLALYFGKPLLEQLSAGVKTSSASHEAEVTTTPTIGVETNSPSLLEWEAAIRASLLSFEKSTSQDADVKLLYIGVNDDHTRAIVDYELVINGDRKSKEAYLIRDDYARYMLIDSNENLMDKLYPPKNSDPLKPRK